MNREVKQQLLDELRSGQWVKGDGYPKVENANGTVCHCTLGVLGELAVRAGIEDVFSPWKRGTGDIYSAFRLEENVTSEEILPPLAMLWAGLKPWECRDIAKRNDNMTSFAQVADYIERVF